ncbi:MAG: tetratricopeptide repeat protein [Candidatus Tectimicrobiota bacterium]
MARGTRGLWRSIKAFWVSLRGSFFQRREARDLTVRRHFQAGLRAVNDGRWAEAEAAFSHVLARQSGHFLAHLYMGVAIYHQGRHAEAHAALVRARRLDPKRFAIYQTSKALPVADPRGRLQGDLLRDLVKNLEECALDLRETGGKPHDVSRRHQRAIRRPRSPEPRRGLAIGGRRRRGRARKPRPSAFSSPRRRRGSERCPPLPKTT